MVNIMDGNTMMFLICPSDISSSEEMDDNEADPDFDPRVAGSTNSAQTTLPNGRRNLVASAW